MSQSPVSLRPGPLFIGIAGLELTAQDVRNILSPNTGGVILFSRNFQSADQVAQLCARIKSLRDPAPVIFVDHEGGRVQRFREGFTAIPAMGALGKLYDEAPEKAVSVAADVGYVLAAELLAVGIDMSFTPVLDLNFGRSDIIGDRSFGRDPKKVTLLAQSLLHGMSQAGMQGCGKHFPGHGWAEADSHVAIPVDERDLQTILQEDAAPYGLLGSLKLASVMPAHVIYPKVDAQPAGFSKVWLQDVLRQRLGYDGCIISDDLGMAGAHVAGGIIERAHAALSAGCDAALDCNELDDIQTLCEATLPQISDQSVQRILSLSRRSVPHLRRLDTCRAEARFAKAFESIQRV